MWGACMAVVWVIIIFLFNQKSFVPGLAGDNKKGIQNKEV